MEYNQNNRPSEEDSTLLEGRNAVWELLRAGRTIDKLFLANSGRNNDLLAEAKKCKIPVVQCDRRKLDHLSPTGNHQGVIAQIAAQEYVSLDDMLNLAEQRQEMPLLIICDGIEDPHNLGAIIRSAEAVGAHGVIIPKRRAVGLTAAVARSAVGALAHIGIHRAGNLAALFDTLKERGIWLFGAEADGTESVYTAPFDRPAALIIGSEGRGLSRLTREKCDYTVCIPLRGKVNSLNVSNAAAILLFEAIRRRDVT